MKALDTNVLARYLRDDDPVQSRRAAQFIQNAIQRGEPLFVDHVVLCELVWILTSVYAHPKHDIVRTIDAILLAGRFLVEDKSSVESALDDYKRSRADFPDCLIGRRNRAFGCESTLTFDRDLKGLASFEVR